MGAFRDEIGCLLDGGGIPDGTLEEIAFSDLFPEDDAAQFNGAWSNYPYFESGSVIVSGIEQGLFVLKPEAIQPDDPDPNAYTITGTPDDDNLKGTPGRDVICGLGGNDTIKGLGGNDVLIGGSGKDTLRGGDGKDRLNARDGVRGNDTSNGGPGGDKCVSDARDVKRSC